MEIEIISKEFIKPSSPTPNHLRHFQLSFLDQIHPNIFNPAIQFYPKISATDNSQRCNLLKQSLSKVLTMFYPVAGRLNNNTYVDCNDEGLLFAVAKVNCQLYEVVCDRNVNNNSYFIPPPHLNEASDLVAFSQVTLFNCGGIAISFSMSHKLGDFFSTVRFINTWSAITRGSNLNTDYKINILPLGSAPTLFPPMDLSGFDTNVVFAKEKLVGKLFEFDSSAVANITAKYGTINGATLSRVEALTNFICSRFMEATQNKNKRCKVTLAVNLRSRMDPPLAPLSFGNYSIPVLADSIRNINADFIKKLQNKDEQQNFLMRMYEDFISNEEEVVSFSFTSVINFPIHEIQFGWGKPLWAATTPTTTKNVVILYSTEDEEGIGALITLKEEDMAKFELDHQLLQHISIPTSQLDAHSRL